MTLTSDVKGALVRFGVGRDDIMSSGNGPVAQWLARLYGIEKVRGSSPLRSTQIWPSICYNIVLLTSDCHMGP